MLSKKVALPILFVCLAIWVTLVVTSGAGWNPLSVNWNFTNTGSFGDSFGPLGAIMAALAAYAAFETLTEQRAEIKRIVERDKAEDLRKIELDKLAERQTKLRWAAESKQIFERNFFNLLSAHREIVREIDIGSGDSQKTSRDAFQRIVRLTQNYNKSGDLNSIWARVILTYGNDLGHYFRFLYHIIRFVDEQDGINKYHYVRLVRAGLSESEIILLFVNCAVGEGAEKFAEYVTKYALLHNVSLNARKQWKMDDHFGPEAFDYFDG